MPGPRCSACAPDGGPFPERRLSLWKSFRQLLVPSRRASGALGAAVLGALVVLLVVERGGRPAPATERILPGAEEVTSLAFSPDGRTLAVGHARGSLMLWDPATGEERQALHGHPDTVWSLAFRPDGKVLASGSRDST